MGSKGWAATNINHILEVTGLAPELVISQGEGEKNYQIPDIMKMIFSYAFNKVFVYRLIFKGSLIFYFFQRLAE